MIYRLIWKLGSHRGRKERDIKNFKKSVKLGFSFIYRTHKQEYLCHTAEKLEDTNGLIRSRKWKKDRQYNDQKKKDKRTKNDLQNITQKTKN